MLTSCIWVRAICHPIGQSQEDVVGDVTLWQENTRNSNMLDFSSGCRRVSQIKHHCYTGRFKFAGQDLNVRKLSRFHVKHSVWRQQTLWLGGGGDTRNTVEDKVQAEGISLAALPLPFNSTSCPKRRVVLSENTVSVWCYPPTLGSARRLAHTRKHPLVRLLLQSATLVSQEAAGNIAAPWLCFPLMVGLLLFYFFFHPTALFVDFIAVALSFQCVFFCSTSVEAFWVFYHCYKCLLATILFGYMKAGLIYTPLGLKAESKCQYENSKANPPNIQK